MSAEKVKKALKNMQDYAAEHDLRVTPPREYVLQIIAGSKQPLTAYEVLEKLGEHLDKPKPPTAYRALEFLSEHGFIHRIESLNAFISCNAGHQHQGSQYLICDQCGRVEEAHLCHVPSKLAEQAKDKGFTLSHWNAELHGTCEDCA